MTSRMKSLPITIVCVCCAALVAVAADFDIRAFGAAVDAKPAVNATAAAIARAKRRR